VYAFLIDVAGEDEQASGTPGSDQKLTNPGRDSTALTIVEVDLASIADPAVQKPTYRVVMRRTWTGKSQTFQYSQLKSLAETWLPRYLAIDATGIGAGLASFLSAAFPGKVLPFVFTGSSKSKLGWDFISIIETGRFKEYTPADETFVEQLGFTLLEVQPGPAHSIKWGVPDGTRNPATGGAGARRPGAQRRPGGSVGRTGMEPLRQDPDRKSRGSDVRNEPRVLNDNTRNWFRLSPGFATRSGQWRGGCGFPDAAGSAQPQRRPGGAVAA
jgi:hypothetical protein